MRGGMTPPAPEPAFWGVSACTLQLNGRRTGYGNEPDCLRIFSAPIVTVCAKITRGNSVLFCAIFQNGCNPVSFML